MNKTWKLKRTAQCRKCPWQVDVDPHDIPNGYDEDKHRALECTIAKPGDLAGSFGPVQHAMACHETHDSQSWVVLLASPIAGDGRVAIGTEERQLLQRVFAREDGLHDGHGSLLGAMLSPIPVRVVYFQERAEVLTAATTGAPESFDDSKPCVIVVLPRTFGFEEVMTVACGTSIPLPFPGFGCCSLDAAPLLDIGFGTVDTSGLTSALLAAGGSAQQSLRVGAEVFRRLREAASAACFHSVMIPPAHCLGWLMNQLGPGNNIGLRIMMMSCENGRAIRLRGEQHETFEETLP